MTLRVVVVGTGFGARVVAPVFSAMRGCEVTDVVSARDSDAIDAALRRARPDLVSVHSPPFLHADHVRRAISAGVRAVLCDKPFATHPDESRGLLAAAEAAGVQHFLNFEFRSDPARKAMGVWIREGAVGRVQHVLWVHHSAGSRVPPRPYGWLFDAALGGGWIGAWASHAVDTLRVMLATDLAVEASIPRTDIVERPDRDGILRPCTAEDGLTARLRATSGASAGATIQLDSTFAAAASLPARLVALGDQGVLENVNDLRVRLRRADGRHEERAFPAERSRDRHRLPMQRWAALVRDAVSARVTPAGVPTFADGVACDEVLEWLRSGGPAGIGAPAPLGGQGAPGSAG